MKKIVRQQNYLKELIESQENKFITRNSLRCIIRAVIEPLLEQPEKGVVLHRIFDKTDISGMLKRLEFSTIESFDFNDETENLVEKVWANTEFLCVLTHRFVIILLWDNRIEDKNLVRYYSIINSKLQHEALDIIARNSKINIKPFQEQFKPDRRDNALLNTSIKRIFENLDVASKDAVLGFVETQKFEEKNTQNMEARLVAHEINNQLSICDLYCEIVKKYCDKNNITDETIIKAFDKISKATKIASNSLVELKTINNMNIKLYSLKNIIDEVIDFINVYFLEKNIELIIENNIEEQVLVDKDKIFAVLINLIKNAVEILDLETDKDGKYIKICTEKTEVSVKIKISNNGIKIENKEQIFEKGFTTKSKGSGLGLFIAKKQIEEQGGKLELEYSEDDYTEFVITFDLI